MAQVRALWRVTQYGQEVVWNECMGQEPLQGGPDKGIA